MDLNSISFLLAFLAMLKSLSLGVSFRLFIHILYSSLYIREKPGLGRTAHTAWGVCTAFQCCGHQQHLLLWLQTTFNIPFMCLTAPEYWSWGFQNTIHFNCKSFFSLPEASDLEMITCLARCVISSADKKWYLCFFLASCLTLWSACVHLCHKF